MTCQAVKKHHPGKNASDGDIAQVETNVDELPAKDITVVKSVSKRLQNIENFPLMHVHVHKLSTFEACLVY